MKNKERLPGKIGDRSDYGKWTMVLEKVNSQLEDLLEKEGQVIIAIDGKSGSGKTSLGKLMEKLYDCNLFHMDDFFLPLQLRTKARLEEIGGNVDYIRFKKEVINKILAGLDFHYRIFDCKHMKETDTISVKSKKINIVEGSYSHHPSLADSYDLKIFLDIDDRTQEERIRKRNGPLMLRRFVEEWIPKENIYFKAMKIRENSHIYFKS